MQWCTSISINKNSFCGGEIHCEKTKQVHTNDDNYVKDKGLSVLQHWYVDILILLNIKI